MWIPTILGWAAIIAIVCGINSWRKNNPGKSVVEPLELTKESQDDISTKPCFKDSPGNIFS